jgi:hypothetical protein
MMDLALLGPCLDGFLLMVVTLFRWDAAVQIICRSLAAVKPGKFFEIKMQPTCGRGLAPFHIGFAVFLSGGLFGR